MTGSLSNALNSDLKSVMDKLINAIGCNPFDI